MKITIDHAGQFRDEFFAHNRQNQFSYEALGLIFDYLEDTDPDYELDVVAICCEYSEATPSELLEMYTIEGDADSDDVSDQVISFLNENTTVLGTTDTGSIVYIQF